MVPNTLRTDVLVMGGGVAASRATYEGKKAAPTLDVTVLVEIEIGLSPFSPARGEGNLSPSLTGGTRGGALVPPNSMCAYIGQSLVYVRNAQPKSRDRLTLQKGGST